MYTQSNSAVIVVAIARNRVIGSNNTIPWLGKLKDDMSYFIDLTSGCPVIMGRKTWESLGSDNAPLKNRAANIVLSRTAEYNPLGYYNDSCKNDGLLTVASSLPEAIEQSREIQPDRPAYIIGGGQVYAEALLLSSVTSAHLTEINAEFPGDCTFPELGTEWVPVKEWGHQADSRNKYPFKWVEYRKE